MPKGYDRLGIQCRETLALFSHEALGGPHFSWGKALDLLEDPTEIGLVLKTRPTGYLVYGEGGLPEQLGGEMDTMAVQIVPGGEPDLPAEDTRQVVFADIDRLSELPA